MGRKDKHKLGKTRNNAVFKVVGAKVSKGAKGKPKGVDVKLKKVIINETLKFILKKRNYVYVQQSDSFFAVVQ